MFESHLLHSFFDRDALLEWFSSKSRKQATDEAAESRIDHLSDHLGIAKGEVINVVNLLREEKILADTKDLTVFIKRSDSKNRAYRYFF